MLAAAAAAKARNIPISCDGNYRASLWAKWEADTRAILGQLVGSADIFFGNERDIGLLLGRDFAAADWRQAVDAAFEAFPDLEVIAGTFRHILRAETHLLSARVDRRDGGMFCEAIEIGSIVDRIGAGDAFATGVLHGLLTHKDDDWAARAGLSLSMLKHSLPGDASLFGCEDLETAMAGVTDVRR